MIIQKTKTAAKRFCFEYEMSLISLFWEIKFNLEYSTKNKKKKKSLNIKIKWVIG